MNRSLTGIAAALIAATTMIFASAATAQQAPKRAITRIAGDLYRFQNNFHFSVFLVTSDGVIVGDPINADAARWLKTEITKRFDKPVRYLVLSHDHPDHSSGGEVFADTATVIAHENARPTIIGEKRPTAVPDITFSERMKIELGGKTVELIYLGPNHSDNLIFMRFPAERVLFVVDAVSPGRVAFKTMGDAYFPGWIDTLRRMEQLDFDVLAPGHGRMGSKADVTAFRQYLEDLHASVLEAVRAGMSLDEMKKSIKLDKYKSWGQYEAWLPLNIEGMYNQIRLHRRPG
jgi:glyoxylase-like metal-dependent hydrolase (beta-lactamase superfamily II)